MTITPGQLKAMPEQERARLLQALVPKLTKYIPHEPTPRQLAFLLLDVREALYGGAAGGGKSDALLMAALQYVDVPSYRALLFRRTYQDLSLPGALMDRAGQWLRDSDAKPGEGGKTWTFPSGAELHFGYLEHDNDRYRYQSAELQFVGFDELTQFTELQYRYLFSRLRRLHGTNIPIRMRSASNPGGEGHEWVKQRFITSDRKDRIFIPARLADNPYLDQHEYRESLNELDPVTRKQLLNGDWTARHAGSWFRREYFDERILDAHDLPAGRASVRYWDLAATEKKPGTDPDYTVGTLMSVDPYGRYYIEDVVRLRGTPASVEYRIKETAGIDGVDVEVWMEEEPGASGKHVIDHYRRQVLPGYAFRGDRVTGPKDVRARPLATQCEGRNVWLVRGPWIGDWIDEAEAWPHGAHKDQVDSASGALSKLVFADEEPTVGPQIYV